MGKDRSRETLHLRAKQEERRIEREEQRARDEPSGAEFSRLAAAVMHSPHFFGDAPEFADPQEHVDWRMARAEERDLLSDALQGCESAGDIPDGVRPIWDRARASLEAEAPSEDRSAERFDVNANPKGCNQHTGPGCAVGSADGPDPAANRPSKPKERHKDAKPVVLPWVDPPAKRPRPAGVKLRPTGDDSQTAVGNLTEGLASQLGFRNVLPPGKRNFTAKQVEEMGSSIDVEYDHSGRLYEIKMCATTSTEYRLKAKKEEKDEKVRYAEGVNCQAWTMVAVMDKEAGTVHFYAAKEQGLTGAEVSKDKFDFVGRVKFKQPKRKRPS